MPTRRPPLTEGPIFGALLGLAVPIVGSNVLQTLFQLTDTFWLGRLGPNAVAAVSIGFPILFFLTAVGGGLSIAGTVLVAQAHGRGEVGLVDRIAGQTLLALVIVSAGLTALGYVTAEPLIGMFTEDPAVREPAVAYLRISLLGLVSVFAYFVFQSLLRGIGNVRTPLILVGGAVVLNFIADPLFIHGGGPVPAMGVAGAAVATIASQGLAGFVGIALLFSGRYGIHSKPRDLRPDPALLARILRIGVPASVEQSARAIGLALMTLLVAGFGTTVVAAYGIGSRILSFVIIPALGLSMATSTVIGQNIGAGRLDRAEATAWTAVRLAFATLSVVGVVLFLAAEPITRVFIPGDDAVVALGARFIHVMSLSFGFLGISQVLTGAFTGSGRTLVSMSLTLFSAWVLRFPTAFVLAERTSLAEDGIWWAFPISNVLAAGLAIAWFSRGTWRPTAPTEDEALAAQVRREAVVDEGIDIG